MLKFGLAMCNHPTSGDVASFYKQQLDQVILADKLGFSWALACEHHFTENHLPSPLIAAAGYGMVTKRIRVGTGILLLPLYNPLRLAEDAATVDVITGGRLIFGVGHGYRTEEYTGYGIQLNERFQRLEEAVNAIRTLWTRDETAFEGKFYRFPKIRLTPKPVQKPHPQIWVAAKGADAVRQAARVGDAWYSDPVTPLKVLKGRYSTYKAALAKSGKKFNKLERPLFREAYVAKDTETAWKDCRKAALVVYGEYYKWGHLLDEDGRPVNPRETSYEQFQEKLRSRFILGSPEECIEQIERYRKELDITGMLFRIHFPDFPHEKVMKTIKLFGEKVAPYFAKSK